nr:alpha-galactosidase [uncultured Clostridium sp.]
MAIIYDKGKNVFSLHTENTTYQFKIGKFGHLLHLYYGKKTTGIMDYLLTFMDRGFSGNPYEAENDRTYSTDTLPQEFPTQGNGDYRTNCLIIKNADGTYCCDLRFKDYNIVKGKYRIPSLPALYAAEDEAYTLEVILEDTITKVEVTLLYGVLQKYDIITRAVRITNQGTKKIFIEKVQSACLDLLSGEYDFIHFYGRHAMERNFERNQVIHGVQSIESRRGTSSHQHNPFIILAERETTEDFGGCYGMNFVYSGNFKAEVELDQMDQTRITMGLQDEMFSYQVPAGESFYAPEVVLSYSCSGFTVLSQNYHKAFRNYLCRGKYKSIPRPIVINNWEATYFDFDGCKIYEIAKQAKELGIDMLVLDDGWFGKRNNDLSSLGDWFVNEEKMGGPLSRVVEKINRLDMKFGLWIEPEMINEDSDLYRKHPDWAFAIPNRKPNRSRYQLVLDFSRKDVVDYIFEQLCAVFDDVNIEYIKWDMNRSITDVYSALAKENNQGEILYRYMLGVYDLLERILQGYPNLFIEGCSGGGGRFDAGMLYYTPQIWCSDNTDAIDRIRIQYGTSFGYPISAVGSHVSAVPNHQTGRRASMKTRGVVAMAGSFGYELDLNLVTEEDRLMVKVQIEDYHRYWDLIHNGNYYRLTSVDEKTEFAAWEFAREDGTECLVNIVTLTNHGNLPSQYIKIKGLRPELTYKIEGEDREYLGSELMYAGISIPYMADEYQAWQIHVIAVFLLRELYRLPQNQKLHHQEKS